jgi:hypothetical protein
MAGQLFINPLRKMVALTGPVLVPSILPFFPASAISAATGNSLRLPAERASSRMLSSQVNDSGAAASC